jgi:hypothetical protein
MDLGGRDGVDSTDSGQDSAVRFYKYVNKFSVPIKAGISSLAALLLICQGIHI